jgi:hypothetical protein
MGFVPPIMPLSQRVGSLNKIQDVIAQRRHGDKGSGDDGDSAKNLAHGQPSLADLGHHEKQIGPSHGSGDEQYPPHISRSETCPAWGPPGSAPPAPGRKPPRSQTNNTVMVEGGLPEGELVSR